MRMRPLIPRLEILARLLMSGFGSLADIRTAKSHVRFTPQEEISETRYLSFTATSFNRLTPPFDQGHQRLPRGGCSLGVTPIRLKFNAAFMRKTNCRYRYAFFDCDLFLHRTKFAGRAIPIPSTNCEASQINLIGGSWCPRKSLLPTKQGDVLFRARGLHDLEHNQTSFGGGWRICPDSDTSTCRYSSQRKGIASLRSIWSRRLCGSNPATE